MIRRIKLWLKGIFFSKGMFTMHLEANYFKWGEGLYTNGGETKVVIIKNLNNNNYKVSII